MKRGVSDIAAEPPATGLILRLTVVKWLFVLTRRPERRTISLRKAALCRAMVKSGRNPSRAIFRML